MKEIVAPAGKRLVWYLAMEEYLAQHVGEEMLFFWVVPPTVIFGRHQVMANEVNVDYCREHAVQMYRRKSGGGCVYADGGNLMISYISPSTHSEEVFQHYLDLLAGALGRMGYPAVKSEHNDVLVGERKVSGNACYALPTGTIVHGTLLWDVDFGALQQAITPSREKLAKHGVESVRQRVVNLRELSQGEGYPRTIEEIQSRLAAMLTQGNQRMLTGQELQEIDAIEQTYLDPDFLYDK